MNQATVFFTGIRQGRLPEDPPKRCCTDEPEFSARVVSPPGRLRKLASAVPASVRAFRGALREPASAPAPAIGSRVETISGTTFGHVEERMIGVESGRTTYAVAAAEDRAGNDVVYLVPRGALRPGRDANVVVIDERRLAARGRGTARLVG
jgi:hypothetical protein